ncbi:MAG: A/G-specific adenine glycosylase, partial [Actinomycetota bacterium]|nr:A/G-specific adenine glycosylase [Actinomycetota bacterium]
MTIDPTVCRARSARAMTGPAPGLTAVQERVLTWGRRAYRDLPWRRTRDPWAILVSELMLQQTQAARVAPRWDAFLVRFPTASDCAAAAVGDVVREWAGLGYNRRAVNLHPAATAVVERYGGSLPDDLEALLGLPGVGPYTARAVLAFAFGADVGLVETNSARLLARAGAGRPLTARDAQAWADALVPPGRGWEWNQAVMDLGSTVCRRRAPDCAECPVEASCTWNRAGRPVPDPADGSAGVGTRQSAFAGSDRQGRGRLVAALREDPVSVADVAATAGWPAQPDRAQRMA